MTLESKIKLAKKLAQSYYDTSRVNYTVLVCEDENETGKYWEGQIVQRNNSSWIRTSITTKLYFQEVKNDGPEECIDKLIKLTKKQIVNNLEHKLKTKLDKLKHATKTVNTLQEETKKLEDLIDEANEENNELSE